MLWTTIEFCFDPFNRCFFKDIKFREKLDFHSLACHNGFACFTCLIYVDQTKQIGFSCILTVFLCCIGCGVDPWPR